MATYTFICTEKENCGATFDVVCSYSEYEQIKDNHPKCPLCDSETNRLYSNLNVGFKFVGSGFYSTDYKKMNEAAIESSTPRKEHSELHWKATEAYEKKVLNKKNFAG